jgi:hypothetical protein
MSTPPVSPRMTAADFITAGDLHAQYLADKVEEDREAALDALALEEEEVDAMLTDHITSVPVKFIPFRAFHEYCERSELPTPEKDTAVFQPSAIPDVFGPGDVPTYPEGITLSTARRTDRLMLEDFEALAPFEMYVSTILLLLLLPLIWLLKAVSAGPRPGTPPHMRVVPQCHLDWVQASRAKARLRKHVPFFCGGRSPLGQRSSHEACGGPDCDAW